jgi:ferric-dicitrate binding protein FerR (iron transport regulator)
MHLLARGRLQRRKIEREAALFVVELSDPHCTDEMRARYKAWIEISPLHRQAFNVLQRTWDETTILLRRPPSARPRRH